MCFRRCEIWEFQQPIPDFGLEIVENVPIHLGCLHRITAALIRCLDLWVTMHLINLPEPAG